MKFGSRKIFFRLILVFALACSFAAAQNPVAVQDDIEDDLQLVPCNQSERLAAVKKLFVRMGAKENAVVAQKFGNGENLTVTIKGKTDDTIVVGAHHDKVDVGCGAIDNWTGIVILAHLYKTLSQYELDKSYIFVAFDKEESGLSGSKAMLKTIPKENYPKYCAMVNMDSFGFTEPEAATNLSDPRMIDLARQVAKSRRILFTTDIIADADADSSTFLAKKIPAITFYGLAHNWQSYLHTANDKLENVNARNVYLSYRFIFEYLTELEVRKCGVF